MQYERVIPRDFFNEAKLLKCLGHLSVKIHDKLLPKGLDIKIKETGEPFEVRLHEDGTLEVVNYPVKVNNYKVRLVSRYNSKSSYPLMCVYENRRDYIEEDVFTEDGEFTQEFLDMAKHFTMARE